MTDHYPTLSIDPQRCWGALVVTGRRVPQDAVAGVVMAGDGVDATAEDYDLHRLDVILCVAQRIVPQGCIAKKAKDWTLLEQWAVDAWASLGAGVQDIPDPPT